ncbi:MAG: hypothetical protein VW931_06690 [Alphaproteobacteria bacterium]
MARSPALYPLLSCAPILGLLCGTAAAATAREIEFRRKHADRSHQTDQAVDATWRLSVLGSALFG